MKTYRVTLDDGSHNDFQAEDGYVDMSHHEVVRMGRMAAIFGRRVVSVSPVAETIDDFFGTNRRQKRVSLGHIEFVVTIETFKFGDYVTRIEQLVNHPRNGTMRRKVFPAHPISKNATTVLEKLSADTRGQITQPIPSE